MALRLAATRIQPDKRKSHMLAAMKHVAEECLWGAGWAGPLSCSQHHRQGIREGDKGATGVVRQSAYEILSLELAA